MNISKRITITHYNDTGGFDDYTFVASYNPSAGWAHVTTGEISQYFNNPPSKILIIVMNAARTSYYGHQIIDIAELKNFQSDLNSITFSFMWSSNACAYGGWQNSPSIEFFYAGIAGYIIHIYKKE